MSEAKPVMLSYSVHTFHNIRPRKIKEAERWLKANKIALDLDPENQRAKKAIKVYEDALAFWQDEEVLIGWLAAKNKVDIEVLRTAIREV